MGRHRTIGDDHLLAAAREVFTARGFGGSTKEVARRAGVSEAVLFQRFRTKAELFLAAMVPPPVDAAALFPRPGRGDAEAALEDVALALLAYFRRAAPVLLPVMAEPSLDFEDFVRRHPGTPLDALRAGLVAHLEAEQAAGRIAAPDPRAAALALFAALFSLALFERLGVHGGAFDDAAVRALVRAQWVGLAPPRRAPRRRPRVR